VEEFMSTSQWLSGLCVVFLMGVGSSDLLAAETIQQDIERLLRTDGLSINGDGKIRFYNDIYNRDQRVLDALDGPVVIEAPDM
jgi:hypothetical protein